MATSAATVTAAKPLSERFKEPGFRAFFMLRTLFIVAPILFGIDKFANVMTEWTSYLAPWINNIMPGSAADFMRFVGVVEIIAGIVVFLAPRIGGYVVVLWLAGIIVNLLTFSGFYDVALRDFGLLIAALALAQLAVTYDTTSMFARRFVRR